MILVITIPIVRERNCSKSYNYDHLTTFYQLCSLGLALVQENAQVIASGKVPSHVAVHPDVYKATTVLNMPIQNSQDNQITTWHTIDHEITKMISMHAILKTLKATKVRGHLKPSKLLLYFVGNIVLYYSIIQSRETIPRHYPNNTQALQYYIISGNNTKTVSKQYTSTTVLYNLGKQYQDIIQIIQYDT